MNIAIVDIGTNTVILLIAKILPNKNFQVLHDECRIVRLGEGINSHKYFLDEAMNRTMAALADYKKIMDDFHCEKRLLVGTAACRNADNAPELFNRIKTDLNLDIQIISGEEEARLIHLTTEKDFSHLEKPILVLDIGGGSTEFIFDDGQDIHETSLPFGSVKLTEKFIHSDPPAKSEIEELTQYIRDQLHTLNYPSSDYVRRTTNDKRLKLIATAGTPTTLCALSQNLDKYEADKVHGQKMSTASLVHIMNKLESLPLNKRAKLPCLPTKRADVIIAGSHILKTTLDYFKLNEFWVSDRGLRYGLLYDRFLS